MAQRITGLYRLTQISKLYSAFQSLLGGEKTRAILRDELIKPQPGLRILDLGCGHASIRPLLGEVEYVGIDLNPDHIARAKRDHAGRGRFHCGDFSSLDGELGGTFDLVLCIGLLHHLDDEQVRHLGEIARTYLRPGGRFFAIDPAFVPSQHWLARLLAARDSGQNVRAPEGYSALIAPAFPDVSITIRHDVLRVPYTHCITQGVKAG